MTHRNLLSAPFVAPFPSAATMNLPADRLHPLDRVGRENLKVTDVKVTIMSFELPRHKRWWTARQTICKSDAVLVEVFTDKGIVAIGESTPEGVPPQIKEYVDSMVRPGLIGKNPFAVEHLTALWTGALRPQQVDWAGIDSALWDIIGKAKCQPVYKLLAADNAPHPHIRMCARGGVEHC